MVPPKSSRHGTSFASQGDAPPSGSTGVAGARDPMIVGASEGSRQTVLRRRGQSDLPDDNEEDEEEISTESDDDVLDAGKRKTSGRPRARTQTSEVSLRHWSDAHIDCKLISSIQQLAAFLLATGPDDAPGLPKAMRQGRSGSISDVVSIATGSSKKSTFSFSQLRKKSSKALGRNKKSENDPRAAQDTSSAEAEAARRRLDADINMPKGTVKKILPNGRSYYSLGVEEYEKEHAKTMSQESSSFLSKTSDGSLLRRSARQKSIGNSSVVESFFSSNSGATSKAVARAEASPLKKAKSIESIRSTPPNRESPPPLPTPPPSDSMHKSPMTTSLLASRFEGPPTRPPRRESSVALQDQQQQAGVREHRQSSVPSGLVSSSPTPASRGNSNSISSQGFGSESNVPHTNSVTGSLRSIGSVQPSSSPKSPVRIARKPVDRTIIAPSPAAPSPLVQLTASSVAPPLTERSNRGHPASQEYAPVPQRSGPSSAEVLPPSSMDAANKTASAEALVDRASPQRQEQAKDDCSDTPSMSLRFGALDAPELRKDEDKEAMDEQTSVSSIPDLTTDLHTRVKSPSRRELDEAGVLDNKVEPHFTSVQPEEQDREELPESAKQEVLLVTVDESELRKMKKSSDRVSRRASTGTPSNTQLAEASQNSLGLSIAAKKYNNSSQRGVLDVGSEDVAIVRPTSAAPSDSEASPRGMPTDPRSRTPVSEVLYTNDDNFARAQAERRRNREQAHVQLINSALPVSAGSSPSKRGKENSHDDELNGEGTKEVVAVDGHREGSDLSIADHVEERREDKGGLGPQSSKERLWAEIGKLQNKAWLAESSARVERVRCRQLARRCLAMLDQQHRLSLTDMQRRQLEASNTDSALTPLAKDEEKLHRLMQDLMEFVGESHRQQLKYSPPALSDGPSPGPVIEVASVSPKQINHIRHPTRASDGQIAGTNKFEAVMGRSRSLRSHHSSRLSSRSASREVNLASSSLSAPQMASKMRFEDAVPLSSSSSPLVAGFCSTPRLDSPAPTSSSVPSARMTSSEPQPLTADVDKDEGDEAEVIASHEDHDSSPLTEEVGSSPFPRSPAVAEATAQSETSESEAVRYAKAFRQLKGPQEQRQSQTPLTQEVASRTTLSTDEASTTP